MNAKAKCASLNRISNLPSIIIENILCLVPIKDAARTSILSKKWRYNWVTIPKLVFNEKDMFDKTTDEDQLSNLERSLMKKLKSCKLFYIVQQVLLQHKGPILEFTLCMEADGTCVEIDQIISHLARNNNALKKLKLDLFISNSIFYELPLSIFSFHQLSDLYICYCTFEFSPTFSGFGSLTSLQIIVSQLSKEALLHLLSNCPLLKNLVLVLEDENIDEDITIIDLFERLPLIEYLCVNDYGIQKSPQDDVPRELPTALVNLKYFRYNSVTLLDNFDLPFVGHVIRSSPNLEKIKLVTAYVAGDPPIVPEMNLNTLEECSDIWLEHLKELEILSFFNIEGELEFVKFILTKSPVLKKVNIELSYFVNKDREIEILRTLLRAPRVSPIAEIIVGRGY